MDQSIQLNYYMYQLQTTSQDSSRPNKLFYYSESSAEFPDCQLQD